MTCAVLYRGRPGSSRQMRSVTLPGTLADYLSEAHHTVDEQLLFARLAQVEDGFLTANPDRVCLTLNAADAAAYLDGLTIFRDGLPGRDGYSLELSEACDD